MHLYFSQFLTLFFRVEVSCLAFFVFAGEVSATEILGLKNVVNPPEHSCRDKEREKERNDEDDGTLVYRRVSCMFYICHDVTFSLVKSFK